MEVVVEEEAAVALVEVAAALVGAALLHQKPVTVVIAPVLQNPLQVPKPTLPPARKPIQPQAPRVITHQVVPTPQLQLFTVLPTITTATLTTG